MSSRQVFHSRDATYSVIGYTPINYCVQIVNEGTKYVGHFLWVPYKDYPTAFEKALEVAGGDVDVEVDEMR